MPPIDFNFYSIIRLNRLIKNIIIVRDIAPKLYEDPMANIISLVFIEAISDKIMHKI